MTLCQQRPELIISTILQKLTQDSLTQDHKLIILISLQSPRLIIPQRLLRPKLVIPTCLQRQKNIIPTSLQRQKT